MLARPKMWWPGINRMHPLARGLIGCWPFWEGAGGGLMDISGHGNHGTLKGMDPATDWVGSPYGTGLDFAGHFSGEYVSVTLGQVGLINNFTLAVLLRPDALGGYDTMVATRTGGLLIGLTLNNTSPYHLAYSWTPAAAEYNEVTGLAMTTGKYHLGVMSVTPTGTTVYLVDGDGLKSNLHTATQDEKDLSGTTWDFMRDPNALGARYVDGVEAGVWMWRRSLSANEIAELYADPWAFMRPRRIARRPIIQPSSHQPKVATLAKPQLWWPGINRMHRLTRGLIGFWPFWEGAGSGLADLQGNRSGTLTNMDPAADWVGGDYGLALDFDGSNDYLALANSKKLPQPNAATWLVVARHDVAASYPMMLTTGAGGAVSELRWQAGNQKLEFLFNWGTNAPLLGPTVITLNDWHVYVATAIAGAMTIYIDGAQEATQGCTYAQPDAATEFAFGARTGGSFPLNGQIALVAMWDRAFSAAEARTISDDPFSFMRLRRTSRNFVPAAAAGTPHYYNWRRRIA